MQIAQRFAPIDDVALPTLALKPEQFDKHPKGPFKSSRRAGDNHPSSASSGHVACSPSMRSRASVIQASGAGMRRHDSMAPTACAAAFQLPAASHSGAA
jgi:hypothetical protein